MKKLIAISVVFVLLAGAAFAQPSLGGNFKVGTKLIGGQSENEIDEVKLTAGATSFDNLALNVNFGDANAGGKFVLFHNAKNFTLGHQPLFAFAWWRPIPQVRLQMGVNADGDWGHADIAGWGYDAEAKAVGVAINTYGDQPSASNLPASRSNAWGPGFNKLGIALSLYPIDGLQINLGIPYENATRAAAIYSNMYLDAKYVLEDIGTVKLAAQFTPGNSDKYVPGDKEGGEVAPNYHWRNDFAEDHQPFGLWAAFNLTAIEGVGVELGLGFTLPYTTQDVQYVDVPNSITKRKVNIGGEGYNELPVNTTVNAPIDIGLGAQFGSGDLNVKARAGFRLGGSTKVNVSRNKAIYDEGIAIKKANENYSNDHVPFDALDLNSDTFLVKQTTKQFDPYHDPESTTAPAIVDVVKWVPRAGTQEKKADPFEWGFNVAPSYKLGDLKVFLNLGIGMKHYAKQEVKVEKQELYTYSDGRTTYVTVHEKKIGDSYDQTSPVVYETITFEGKPITYDDKGNVTYSGVVYKGKNLDAPWKSQSEENAAMNNCDIIKAELDWFINPYVQIPAGGGQFYAGIKLYADGTRIAAKYNYNKTNADAGVAGSKLTADTTKFQVKWSIPIGFNFYF